MPYINNHRDLTEKGNKGLIASWDKEHKETIIHCPLWLAVFGAIILMAVPFVAGILITIDRATDTGERMAYGKLNAAFQEQMAEQKTFTIKGIKGVTFMPQKGGKQVSYIIAGAGADSGKR